MATMQWAGASDEAADAFSSEAGRNPGQSGLAAVFSHARLLAGQELPCAQDPELFFAEAPADVEAAKDLCRGCMIRRACLQGALDRREPWGVWGGELFLRGTVVPRKRPRGRPRKEEPGLAKLGGRAA